MIQASIAIQEAASQSVVDWKLAVSVGLPALVAVLVLLLGHYFTERRERSARRRQARIEALQRLYMKLAMFAGGTLPHTATRARDFEEFVAELQLFGSPGQVEILKGVVEEMLKPNNRVSLDEILMSLRDELRAELQLEGVSGPVWWYRFPATAILPESAPIQTVGTNLTD